ncbi:endo alpha-1,4 polygalactosaminidase [Nocardioides abyssi]|uniref:Endo alpha-1,4 polygalactosaminidase n=1 Tax=Nocardioides abyssi TaxID=3058370 RepID=A0ABT8EXD2_9ACTN|nr:endo alpha-1,4 polygalactosaminidase [Nocardioides abyssi]MDN4162788.1 endo alpha-1,4 polygalactosaminidase [Nocardioides abyssi]
MVRLPALLGALLSLVLVSLVLPAGPAAGKASPEVQPLPVGTHADYQLGGVRPVPTGVGIVVRDRRAEPAGRYDVCYVNAFQTQPGERRSWRQRMHLVLRDERGPVVDEDWGEWLLDVRTAPKRRALARIVGRWVDRCAADGYEAVEYDNLDSFTRSRGLVSRRQALAYARLVVAEAHEAGLAAGQKNLAGLDGTRLGFDFAVAEECARYRECGAYAAAYGRRVVAVEYRAQDFRRACRRWGSRLPVVLRDLAVSPTGVRRFC